MVSAVGTVPLKLLESQPMEVFRFGTKAETLESLSGKLQSAQILAQYYFDTVLWQEKKGRILNEIENQFSGRLLAVRSSAQNEDGEASSMAGAYDSVLNVAANDIAALTDAIEQVIDSYEENCFDQVLIQPMVTDVSMSGVAMTHDIETGAPYYVISYDDNSGRTDTVTSGNGVNKTVLIHHDYENTLVESQRIQIVLAGIHELESVCGGVPLDIEFVLTNENLLYILQVRRIALHKTWHPATARRTSRKLQFIEQFIKQRSQKRAHLLGERTLLGIMSDWNPAEIIGVTPRPLATSLYRHLVTKHIWRDARAMMGYRDLPGEELMVVVDYHPYIDIRNSFNSFLPADITDETGDKLVNAWLQRLSENPEMHDKVEFDVAHTCLDVNFDISFHERYPDILTASEYLEYRALLTALTNRLLDVSHQGNLHRSMARVLELSQRQSARTKDDLDNCEYPLIEVNRLLVECQQYGTLPFACLARHGFIAETILRSLVARGAISENRATELKQSIQTITGDLVYDYQNAVDSDENIEAFLAKYGHLRPGTYDITSSRYDECNDLFTTQRLAAHQQEIEKSVFQFTDIESRNIQRLFDETGLICNPHDLLQYIHDAITGRELGKFVFTRNLSDALYCLSRWGEMIGLSCDDVSFLEWRDIYATALSPILDHQDKYFLDLAADAEKGLKDAQPLRLGYLLRDARDVFVVPLNRNEPNYVTARSVKGMPVLLDSKSPTTISLYNRIVCIENADPGFDWIFTKGILGLITQFGGANSHMAIRCAEFGIPAAIGCGEQTFRRIITSDTVILNCQDKILKPLHHG